MARQDRLLQAVACSGERILWVGSNSEATGFHHPETQIVDCEGRTLIPGFIDSHCHLLAYASSKISVDCGPSTSASIQDVKDAILNQANKDSLGQWIRGVGYDHLTLKEKRHLNRWDLDSVVSDRPVRLNHRSGHAIVLNSLALKRVGISITTPDPLNGVIERDANGEPTGLLLDMDEYLNGRIPSLPYEVFVTGVKAANQQMMSNGVTSIQDATHSNSLRRWETFKNLKDKGDLDPRIRLMVGLNHLNDFLELGMRFGLNGSHLDLGHVKIMLTQSTGNFYPNLDELTAIINEVHRKRFPVAIHAVELEAVELAVNALSEARKSGVSGPVNDRIEHCSECSTIALRKLTGANVSVVTQPGLLYERGHVYVTNIPSSFHQYLYRIKDFFDSGLTPAGGSDAPVTEPKPLDAIYSAVTRKSKTGDIVSPEQGISVYEALKMYTVNPSKTGYVTCDRGTIEPGKLADLVILDQNPLIIDQEAIRDISVMKTLVGGQIAWEL